MGAPDWVDVFAIENGDFPACYVSELRGVVMATAHAGFPSSLIALISMGILSVKKQLFLVGACCFFHPKYPDPSKVHILRTYRPLLYMDP